MTSSRPQRTIHRTRIRRRRVAGVLVVIAVVAVLGDQLPALSSTAGTPAVGVRDGERHPPRDEHDTRRGRPPGALGEADGAVPEGTTVFDDHLPGVAKLDPALLGALRRAAIDAADEGVELLVDSGWRSPEYQQRLLDEAVAKYGSEEQAARWVAAPDRSPHVSGDAVDVGPDDATAWLSQHGAEYGLCQIYGNESWHYELRPQAADLGCPPMYADPRDDPRMR